jgi:hypothetical protein
MVISNISLALFEDSGWYMPNYELAEDMWWGKDRGCDFIHHKRCPPGDPDSNRTGEFCTFTDSADFSFGCDVDGDTMTQCTTSGSAFSEGCPVRKWRADLFGDCHEAEPSPALGQTYEKMLNDDFQSQKSDTAKCFRIKST